MARYVQIGHYEKMSFIKCEVGKTSFIFNLNTS